MAERQIQGLRAIVTGASSGIGRAVAGELVRQGGHCVAVARNQTKLQSLQDEIKSAADSGGSLEIVPGDITAAETRQRAVQQAVRCWGGLDALVNNAGIAAFGRFADGQPERLRQIMEVNFFATVEMIREALPVLGQGHRPIIVNVASILGHRGIPRMYEYCASKFALQGLSQVLRVELKKKGIDLLVVSPGTTQTDFYDHVVHGRGDAPWSSSYRVMPEDVARATVNAMRRGRREIFPNVMGRLLVWANRIAPSVVDRFLGRYA
ncbi:MAG: SDR family NAD(P)-dependent oxidoreductase [Planctomycetales bacterium]|nr:SDR family NAD(P)-dependent oxidoreductase [Planctomycetales bacterium]NIM10302.1 SDR family NAD(P)-dependent oxidoreductase [Planctomycetales bacterium]NIN09741.1 SDR family NAD(P)-dependent oxidoreductase [Planctomycetales bacterium]NIN78866.1 SDR family NAD(P)-dependent oxidoreductase [Planctomycetales bacterium]NIO36033.1 SDR family NAD(P)-dependent oxidoreductase [Planctomycetales bacterium]